MRPEQANRVWDVMTWVDLNGFADRRTFGALIEPWLDPATADRAWSRLVEQLRELDAPVRCEMAPESEHAPPRLVLARKDGITSWLLKVVTPPEDDVGEENDPPLPSNWRSRVAAVREEKEARTEAFRNEIEARGRRILRDRAEDSIVETGTWARA